MRNRDTGTEILTNWNMEPGVPNALPFPRLPTSGSAKGLMMSDSCIHEMCVVLSSPEDERKPIFWCREDHVHPDKAMEAFSLVADYGQ
jgi:hypothetical protein